MRTLTLALSISGLIALSEQSLQLALLPGFNGLCLLQTLRGVSQLCTELILLMSQSSELPTLLCHARLERLLFVA